MDRTAIEDWEARRSGLTTRRSQDERTAWERDRARVIHCASFRRLQAKTQVLGISEGDFHRTRLTHSMEVAQISGGLVQTLAKVAAHDGTHAEIAGYLPDQALVESIAFCHDLGHPPFGHGGEIALNYMMRDSGGFEGNGQSLRILTRLESHTEGFGLDLTRRTLLGILKYPVMYETAVRKKDPLAPENYSLLRAGDWKPPKCFLGSESAVVEWLLEPFSHSDREKFTQTSPPEDQTKHAKSIYKALDTSIMELADDIAYGVHDLEDGIALGLITREHWSKINGSLDGAWAAQFGLGTHLLLEQELFGDAADVQKRADASAIRKRAIGAMVNALISSARPKRIGELSNPILAYNAELDPPARQFLDALKGLTSTHIVKLQSVQTLEYRGRYLVMSLFEAMTSDPIHLLNASYALAYQEASSESDKRRVICDYVAGMTDSYAARVYERLFVPGVGNVFEHL